MRSLSSFSVRHSGAERFLLWVSLTLVVACNRVESPIRLYGEAQGTYYTVQYFDEQHRNLQPQVDSLLAAFDQSASLWVDSSLLRQINAGKTDSLDDILLDLLSHSLQICQYTDGAFDPRVGKLVQAWGFSFKEHTEPDSAAIAALLQAAQSPIGYSGNRYRRSNEATELDFNAIAQGYASDLMGAMLERYGIENYLVDIGGEVVAHGCKPGNQPWRVGIERPASERDNMPEVMTSIRLDNASVVTSGNYRKYYERDGVRYSHTINPTTGRPVQHSLLSVSVVESSSWLADAMATAYMVMGLDSAQRFIAAHPGGLGTEAVFFIYDDHGQLATYATPKFEDLLIQQ